MEQFNDDEPNEPDDWLQRIVEYEKIMQETQIDLQTKLNTNEGLIVALDSKIKALKDDSDTINMTFKHIHEFIQKAASHHDTFLKDAQKFYPYFEDFSAQLKLYGDEFLSSESVLDQNIEHLDAALERPEKEEAFWKEKVEEFDEAQLQQEMEEAMNENEEDKNILSELKCKLDYMIAFVKEQGDIKQKLVKEVENMKGEAKTVDEELLVASHMLNDIKTETTGIEELQKANDETENRIQKSLCDAEERQKIISEMKEKIKNDEVLNDGCKQTIEELQDKYTTFENKAKGYLLKAAEIEKSALEEITQLTSKIIDLDNEIKTKTECSAQLSQEQSEINTLVVKYSADISDLKSSLNSEDQEPEIDYDKKIEQVDMEIESEKSLLHDAQKEYDAIVAKHNQAKTEIETEIKRLTGVLNDKKKLHEDTKELYNSLNDNIKKMLSEIEKNKLQSVILSKDGQQILAAKKATTQKASPERHPPVPPKKVMKRWDSDSSGDVVLHRFAQKK